MAIKYDPIMCMMVNDTVKSNDSKVKDASFNVVYKSVSGTMQALVMAGSEKEAEEKVRNREGTKFISLIGVKKMSDERTIDKAIKSCDDLNSDKEKALEEYKEAEKKWRKITEGATLREFRQLQHSQEYLDFVKAKNKCMHLGCRI